MMFYLCDNLPIQEVFHPDYFDYFKMYTGWSEEKINKHLASWIPDHFLVTFTELRKTFGPLYYNNWHKGGFLRNSGKRMRPFNRNGQAFGEQKGAYLSSHYESNGTGDAHFINATPEEVQLYIMENPEDFPFIYRMEHVSITPTWNHIETAIKRDGEILLFQP